MKKIIIFLIFFLLNLSVISAAKNPYKQTSSYGTNCTWYAWKMAYEKGGVALPGWGNAKNWYSDAKKDGYKVGQTPKANSIVVWGNWTSYGHVGYVESVSSNTLHVWDSTGPCIDYDDIEFKTCMANGVSEETDKICYANAKRKACEYTISPSDYKITGYIYLDEKPTKKPSSNSSNSSSSSKKEETKKSSNTNLKSLEITNLDISFTKDNYLYELEVPYYIADITISAKPEDEKSTISGIGEYQLKLGLNEFEIIVTAEDKTTKTYKINITRNNLPKKEEQSKVEIKKVSKEKKNYPTIIIALIIITILIVMPFIIILIYKHKKNK